MNIIKQIKKIQHLLSFAEVREINAIPLSLEAVVSFYQRFQYILDNQAYCKLFQTGSLRKPKCYDNHRTN